MPNAELIRLSVPVPDDLVLHLHRLKSDGQTIEELASLYLRVGLMSSADVPQDYSTGLDVVL